jgi:hypothetical protein
MKNAASCLVVIFVLAVGSIAAQGQQMLKANVPFDFTIGNTHLSSGTYIVSQVGSEAEAWYDSNGKGVALFLTTPMSDPTVDLSRYVLQFNRNGGEYILSEVWTGQRGHEVRANGKKIRLAKAAESDRTLVAMQVSK